MEDGTFNINNATFMGETNTFNPDQSVFVDLTFDASFKIIFADKANKKLLIGLLNTILPEEAHVVDIAQYLDREQNPDTQKGKKTQLDVICEGDDGRRFLVEFQRSPDSYFFQRCVFYGAGAYHIALDSGKMYESLHPVYVVSLLNYKRPQHNNSQYWDTDHIISHYVFREKRTGEFAPPTISVTFVELGRFTKSEDECVSDRDKLFYIFKHSGLFKEMPQEFKGKPFLGELLEACEIAAFPKDKKLLYNTEIMNEIDILSQRKYAQELGFEEGRLAGEQAGREVGLQEGIEKVAKNMLSAGIPADTVASCTGLTTEELKELL